MLLVQVHSAVPAHLWLLEGEAEEKNSSNDFLSHKNDKYE